MYGEDDLLALSGLQHMVYCERQWALIHLEQAWAENRWTAEGRALHERVDEVGKQSRRDVRIVRGLQIHSLRLGLIGRADVVEFHRETNPPSPSECVEPPPPLPRGDTEETPESCALRGARGPWRPMPVEYKRGQSKRANCDRVQLCAQAFCLEEMLGVSIREGSLFYGKTRRREAVSFDSTLRQQTEDLAVRMHTLYQASRTPVVAYESKRCDRCSLISRCMPKITGASLSVEKYISLALS